LGKTGKIEKKRVGNWRECVLAFVRALPTHPWCPTPHPGRPFWTGWMEEWSKNANRDFSSGCTGVKAPRVRCPSRDKPGGGAKGTEGRGGYGGGQWSRSVRPFCLPPGWPSLPTTPHHHHPPPQPAHHNQPTTTHQPTPTTPVEIRWPWLPDLIVGSQPAPLMPASQRRAREGHHVALLRCTTHIRPPPPGTCMHTYIATHISIKGAGERASTETAA
jgi:hypothetical protein